MFGDLIYVGTEKLAEEIEGVIAAEFPSARFNRRWDMIHEWQVGLEIPEVTPERFYKFAIREGFPRWCLGFQLALLEEPQTIEAWLDQLKGD